MYYFRRPAHFVGTIPEVGLILYYFRSPVQLFELFQEAAQYLGFQEASSVILR